MARDGFSKKTVDDLAKRAGYVCSNPECKQETVGLLAENSTGQTAIGIAEDAARRAGASDGEARLYNRGRKNRPEICSPFTAA